MTNQFDNKSSGDQNVAQNEGATGKQGNKKGRASRLRPVSFSTQMRSYQIMLSKYSMAS